MPGFIDLKGWNIGVGIYLKIIVSIPLPGFIDLKVSINLSFSIERYAIVSIPLPGFIDLKEFG